MKVGTDGVLIGAWADVENIKSVLDIGCGTGLISLMIAQRCNAVITGVEYHRARRRQCQAHACSLYLADKDHAVRVILEPGYLFGTVTDATPDNAVGQSLFLPHLLDGIELRPEAGHDHEFLTCSHSAIDDIGQGL